MTDRHRAYRPILDLILCGGIDVNAPFSERRNATPAQKLFGTRLDNGVKARLKILDGLRDSRPERESTTTIRRQQ